jgi:Protein of unknown function (DUF1566)
MKRRLNVISRFILLFGLFLGLLVFQVRAEPYVLHTSGTMVLDKATGLIWMRCTLGEKWDGQTCSGAKTGLTFDEAMGAAKTFNKAGGVGNFTDWVVPQIRQLHGLVDCFDERVNRPNRGEPAVTGEHIQSSLKLNHYCATTKNSPYIHSIAFPLTSSERYRSSNQYSYPGSSWGVLFEHGSVSWYGHNTKLYVRLVRASKISSNESIHGFSQQLPSGLEVFRTNQKSKK